MDRQNPYSTEEEPNDMKLRIVALLLAAVLLCAVMPAALDEFGNEIVSENAGYTNMYARDNFFKVEVESSDGVHDTGLIDAWTGKVIVPPKYADVEIISDRWQSGIILTPSDADNKDYTYTNYSTNEKLFFRVESVDYYWRL